MQSGKLRHLVTIQTPTESLNAVGDSAPTWATYKTVWAEVRPITVAKRLEAMAVEATASHTVRIRHADAPAITTRMRVLYDGRYLYISSVINLDERDREVVLMCMEDVA